VPALAHVFAVVGLVSAVALAGKAVCHRSEAAPRVEAEERLKPPGLWTETTTLPPEADNLECLLDTAHGRIHVEFGYRGCFGGSHNDLDLDVATTASVTAHLWTGPSRNPATEIATLTRAAGQAVLRLLVDALIKEDEANAVWTTTETFVRVSYQCGTRRWGPFTVETQKPDEEADREFASVVHRPPPRHFPYSRVHATIAAARSVLALQ